MKNMEDTSFIDLIKEENLKKINIDERLIPIFITVMKNFQEFFNYMGYTKERNYKEFFEKYLLKDSAIKMAIKCNRKPSKIDSYGYYCYPDREIVINDNLLNSKIDLIATLTHEFIHFLVTDYLMGIREYKKVNIFLEEALTESLKMKILPFSYNGYLAEINMMNYWLKINNKNVNYSDYLNKGSFYDIDDKFFKLLDECITSKTSKDKEINFTEAQRYIINSIDINISSIEEYEKIVSKIEGRVLDDTNFIKDYYKKLNEILINNLEIDDDLRNEFLTYLEKYKSVVELLACKNNFKNTFYLETDKHIYEIDKRKNLFKDGRFVKKVKKLIYKENSEVKEINFNDIDFKQIEMENEYYESALIRIKEEIENILKSIQESSISKIKVKKI